MPKRAWLIGCGPSINDTPLDLLIGRDTFSLNKIHRIYPKTKWRPTYFFYLDHATHDHLWRDPVDANTKTAQHMWLLDEYRTGLASGVDGNEFLSPENAIGDIGKTTWLTRCKQHHYYSVGNPKAMQEWHLPDICTAYGGVSNMMQVAVQMGYEEIYLVGCDLGYQYDWHKNHFDPDYDFGNEPQHDYEMAFKMQSDESSTKRGHEIAKIECDKRGVKVYNATIGGFLEIYERKDFLDALKD
jgi:hypothetical protein